MLTKIKKLFGICDHEYIKTNICSIINARLECVKCKKTVWTNLISDTKRYKFELRNIKSKMKGE
jgi:hypothetical protein